MQFKEETEEWVFVKAATAMRFKVLPGPTPWEDPLHSEQCN
jgi:hypothetical protein